MFNKVELNLISTVFIVVMRITPKNNSAVK